MHQRPFSKGSQLSRPKAGPPLRQGFDRSRLEGPSAGVNTWRQTGVSERLAGRRSRLARARGWGSAGGSLGALPSTWVQGSLPMWYGDLWVSGFVVTCNDAVKSTARGHCPHFPVSSLHWCLYLLEWDPPCSAVPTILESHLHAARNLQRSLPFSPFK